MFKEFSKLDGAEQLIEHYLGSKQLQKIKKIPNTQNGEYFQEVYHHFLDAVEKYATSNEFLHKVIDLMAEENGLLETDVNKIKKKVDISNFPEYQKNIQILLNNKITKFYEPPMSFIFIDNKRVNDDFKAIEKNVLYICEPVILDKLLNITKELGINTTPKRYANMELTDIVRKQILMSDELKKVEQFIYDNHPQPDNVKFISKEKQELYIAHGELDRVKNLYMAFIGEHIKPAMSHYLASNQFKNDLLNKYTTNNQINDYTKQRMKDMMLDENIEITLSHLTQHGYLNSKNMVFEQHKPHTIDELKQNILDIYNPNQLNWVKQKLDSLHQVTVIQDMTANHHLRIGNDFLHHIEWNIYKRGGLVEKHSDMNKYLDFLQDNFWHILNHDMQQKPFHDAMVNYFSEKYDVKVRNDTDLSQYLTTQYLLDNEYAELDLKGGAMLIKNPNTSQYEHITDLSKIGKYLLEVLSHDPNIQKQLNNKNIQYKP